LGGLIGEFEVAFGGHVTNSSSTASINAEGSGRAVGGLLGYVSHDRFAPVGVPIQPSAVDFYVENCYSTGDVVTHSISYVGGFIGAINQSVDFFATFNCRFRVDKSYTTGNVTGNIQTGGSGRIGGFIGRVNCSTGSSMYLHAYLDITHSYASGLVEGSARSISGFIGMLDVACGNINIANSFSIGSDRFIDEVSVFGGTSTASDTSNWVHIRNSYSTGAAITDSSHFVGTSHGYTNWVAPGVFDVNNPTYVNPTNITNCFFGRTTPGVDVSTTAQARTGAEMKTQPTFTGWDFGGTVWLIDEGESYPYLKGLPNPYVAGTGVTAPGSNTATLTFGPAAADIDTTVIFDAGVTDVSAHPNRIFTITYDANRLELLDFAAQTPVHDTLPGLVAGTDLEIISISPGAIRFISHMPIGHNASYSGTLSLIRFKIKQPGGTTIRLAF
jgi:hypothetical protein